MHVAICEALCTYFLICNCNLPSPHLLRRWHIGADEFMKDGVYGIDHVAKRAGGERDEWYKDETVYDAAIDFIKVISFSDLYALSSFFHFIVALIEYRLLGLSLHLHATCNQNTG